jgi:hypothetical protein
MLAVQDLVQPGTEQVALLDEIGSTPHTSTNIELSVGK